MYIYKGKIQLKHEGAIKMGLYRQVVFILSLQQTTELLNALTCLRQFQVQEHSNFFHHTRTNLFKWKRISSQDKTPLL